MRSSINFALLLAVSLAMLTSCSAIASHHDHLMHAVTEQESKNDPLSGEWNVSFFVNDQTTPATFNLKLDGGNITGTAYSEHTGPGTIRDGKWENGNFSFTLDFKKHESIAVKGNLGEAMLKGEFTTEGFTSKWEAKKK